MSVKDELVYLIDPSTRPIFLKIRGRANYLNCGSLNELFYQLIHSGCNDFAIDFQDCTGMDSTFLGILAGVALNLKEPSYRGSLCLLNLEEQNLEIIMSLGLHYIMSIDSSKMPQIEKRYSTVDHYNATLSANRDSIIKAHEVLAAINAENKNRFKDVIAFLTHK